MWFSAYCGYRLDIKTIYFAHTVASWQHSDKANRKWDDGQKTLDSSVSQRIQPIEHNRCLIMPVNVLFQRFFIRWRLIIVFKSVSATESMIEWVSDWIIHNWFVQNVLVFMRKSLNHSHLICSKTWIRSATKLATARKQMLVFVSESLNHSFSWFIQKLL